MNIKIIEQPQQVKTQVNILCHHNDQEVQRLYRHIHQFAKTIIGKKDHTSFPIPIYEIYYFESVDGKTFFYTKNETYESSCSLASLEQELAQEPFTRIGKSCILNIKTLHHVEPFSNHRLLATLQNGESQIISRFYIHAVKEKIQLFLS